MKAASDRLALVTAIAVALFAAAKGWPAFQVIRLILVETLALGCIIFPVICEHAFSLGRRGGFPSSFVAAQGVFTVIGGWLLLLSIAFAVWSR